MYTMITKQITIKGSTIRNMLQQNLQLKAEELEITGTMKINQGYTLTLIASGNKDNLERYIAWCEAAVAEHGVAVTETRDLGFKAFHRFSLT